MINLNLIPVDLRKKSKGLLGGTINLPREILLGVGVLVVFLLVLIHSFLTINWLVKRIALQQVSNNWKSVEPDKKAIDAIGEEVKAINKKMKSLEDFVKKRQTTWSQKINIISDVMPKGVWLTKLVIDEKSLVLQGMGVSKQRNEIVMIGSLNTALKKEPMFASDFSNIEVNAINRAKFNTADVSQFTLTAKLK